MRISTKLALTCGFIVTLSLVVMTGTARADESNQTKINSISSTENVYDLNQQPTCSIEKPIFQVIPEEKPEIKEDAKEDIEEKKEEIIQKKKTINTENLPKGKFVINASAYTAAADECGKSDGITASGVKVRENETIACPKNFAFGTKINIEGYGTYICQDRGGAIKGNKIDIYMETKAEAFAFGRRNLVAEVVME